MWLLMCLVIITSFLWTALASATLPPLLTSTSDPILLVSADLLLPSSRFPFLSPQIETGPWLYLAPTTHLQLSWCQLAAVSSLICTYSSFSWVKTPGKHRSLAEAAFLAHRSTLSLCHHAGIVPWQPQGCSCPLQTQSRYGPVHTQDISMVPSIIFEDKPTKWSDGPVCGAPYPICLRGSQHRSQFPRVCDFKQLFLSL